MLRLLRLSAMTIKTNAGDTIVEEKKEERRTARRDSIRFCNGTSWHSYSRRTKLCDKTAWSEMHGVCCKPSHNGASICTAFVSGFEGSIIYYRLHHIILGDNNKYPLCHETMSKKRQFGVKQKETASVNQTRRTFSWIAILMWLIVVG